MTVMMFNRVAGIALHEGQVLLHRAEMEDFWTLPGGQIEPGESTETALKREMQEELHTEVTVGKLCYVVENFFPYSGKDYHEIGLYFQMQLPPDSPLLLTQMFDGIELYFNNQPAFRLIFEWTPLNTLAGKIMKPAFLSHELPQVESLNHTRHIIHDGRE
ncbi:MAG: NUDIX hydrolase [Anaerolineae bacterium]|nr:NUDIX hydrolase [Anaerolineae bacterium]